MLPFHPERLKAGIVWIDRQFTHSTLLNSLFDNNTVPLSDNLGTAPAKIARSLYGDLDLISLSPDNDRYALAVLTPLLPLHKSARTLGKLMHSA
jgi:hypothetical protein